MHLPYEIIDIILIKLDDIMIAYDLNRIYVIDKLKMSRQLIIYRRSTNIERINNFINVYAHALNLNFMRIISGQACLFYSS